MNETHPIRFPAPTDGRLSPEMLAAFAREGLRTLVLAQRVLTEKESDAFRKQWRAADGAFVLNRRVDLHAIDATPG